MNLLEVIVLILALLGGFLIWQAHKNHATLRQQYDSDTAALKADVLELKINLAVHVASEPPPSVTTAGTGIPPPASISTT